MLSTFSCSERLCNDTMSVCLSVCLSHRLIASMLQRRASGLQHLGCVWQISVDSCGTRVPEIDQYLLPEPKFGKPRAASYAVVQGITGCLQLLEFEIAPGNTGNLLEFSCCSWKIFIICNVIFARQAIFNTLYLGKVVG